MSNDIRPGDVVVLTDADCPHCFEDASLPEAAVAIGGYARVASVVEIPGSCPDIYLVGDTAVYCMRWLRKIDAPKTEISEMIRACRPIKHREPVA